MGLEWLRSRGMESGQFGLLEKSASWAQVGGGGGGGEVGASWLLNDESVQETKRTLGEGWGPR